ncbi:hypothetical protein QWZ03_05750 [Chitinimonas viridis]|uniref:VCBS repeat-containing protein n=1 Tax=Chitinimonas viridis TaxID=664880 RepID=A0ABT8B3M6_9NEIS|nr:hypothetical protein [Chitinimonas viridis]MDN3576266.1 hypothetical protein [Chitinimonas viridis]
MKIEQSQVQLAGQREAARRQTIETRINTSFRPAPPPPQESVALSTQGVTTQAADTGYDLRLALESNPLWPLVRQLVKHLTGRDLETENVVPAQRNIGATTSGEASAIPAGPAQAEWRIDYHYREVLEESEYTRFTAGGRITTADGQEIAFSAALDLSRYYREEREFSLTAASPGMKKDPLVINYAAATASLGNDKVTFDLDADGQLDTMSFLGQGSGFLALDANQDGTINDGSELFGALSGNGFADLARHDQDGNGWIDENDGVWAQLKLWTRDTDGVTHLSDLKSLGIGALYLDNAQTDFSLTDQQNIEHGQIRRSGIYLSETGKVGTMQQLDLVV